MLPGLALAVALANPTPGWQLQWELGEGAAGCLDAGGLAAAVEEHLGVDVFTDETGGFSLDGEVRLEGDRFRARLRVRDAAGTLLGEREHLAPGPGCRQLDEAVVLIVALLTDPQTGVGASEPETAKPPPPPEARSSVTIGAASRGASDKQRGPESALLGLAVAAGTYGEPSRFSLRSQNRLEFQRGWSVEQFSQIWAPGERTLDAARRAVVLQAEFGQAGCHQRRWRAWGAEACAGVAWGLALAIAPERADALPSFGPSLGVLVMARGGYWLSERWKLVLTGQNRYRLFQPRLVFPDAARDTEIFRAPAFTFELGLGLELRLWPPS